MANTTRTIELADLIVSALNTDLEAEVQFTAQRVNLPRHRMEDLGTLQVTVVPRAREHQDNGLIDHTIEIGISQHVSDINDLTTTDKIALTVEQIENYLLTHEIDTTKTTDVASLLADNSLFSEDHTKDNVYSTVLRVVLHEYY